MGSRLSRRAVMGKTMQVGVSTLISRVIGLARELLQIKYLGVGPVSDAFVAAFRIPNSLRKIFAEGALSAAFIPTFVTVLKHEGVAASQRLLSTLFVVIELCVVAVCMLIALHADKVMYLAAPGWIGSSVHAEQLVYAEVLLKILIFFTACISSTSLLAGALQGMHHFTVPAWGQVVMNVIYCAELLACMHWQLPVWWLAVGIVLNGMVLVIMHLWAYAAVGGAWLMPTRDTWVSVYAVLKKFVPCLITAGAVEINIFIDQMLASYLPSGSVSLMYYTWSLARLPIGVFAVAFSTILLPQLSRLHAYAPRRLGFYVYESIKLVAWVTIPVSVVMSCFAYRAFSTLFLSDHFTVVHVLQAQQLLIAFAWGIFFFCLNKLLLSVFYAVHANVMATIISLGGTILNTLLNLMLMRWYGAWGIACATSFAAAVQTAAFLFVLWRMHGIRWYPGRVMHFFIRLTLVMLVAGVGAFCMYYGAYCLLERALEGAVRAFFLEGYGYWLWVTPLWGFFAVAWWFLRRSVGLRLYFIE